MKFKSRLRSKGSRKLGRNFQSESPMRAIVVLGFALLVTSTSGFAEPTVKRPVSRICVHKNTSRVVVRTRCRKSETTLTDLASFSAILGIEGEGEPSPSPTPGSTESPPSPTPTPFALTTVIQTSTGVVLAQGLKQVTALCPTGHAAIGGNCVGSGGLTLSPPQDDTDLEGRSFSCRWRNPSVSSISANITTKALCAPVG